MGTRSHVHDLDCDDEEDLGPAPPSRIVHRPVRGVTTVAADGAESSAVTVHCPSRAETVPVATCVHCERFIGIRPESEGRPEAVACRLPFPEPIADPARGAWARGPLLDAPVAALRRDVTGVRGDVTVAEAARLGLAGGFSALPVVDRDGQPIGVVSRTDLVRESLPHGALVKDIMTPRAFSVMETATLREAVRLMAKHSVHRVFVVSLGGAVTGVVSALDVVRWLAEASA